MTRQLKVLAFIGVCTALASSPTLAQEKFLRFQSVDYRTGGANRAFIGSVGLKRKEGANTFYVMYRPSWKDLPIERTGAFGKNSEGKYQFAVTATNISGAAPVKVGFDMNKEFSRQGTFTIYQISDIKQMVDQLNSPANDDLRKYFMQSKDFRIVTAMVVVTGHKDIESKASSIKLSGSSSATSGTPVTVEVAYSGSNSNTLTINDNMIYAYEYGRLIWAKEQDDFFGHKLGHVVDILVDRPSSLFSWSDSKSSFENGTDNPKEPLAKLRQKQGSKTPH